MQYIPINEFKNNLATYFPTFFKNNKDNKEKKQKLKDNKN